MVFTTGENYRLMQVDSVREKSGFLSTCTGV